MSKMFIAAMAALALVAVSCGNRPGSPAAVCENGRFIGTVLPAFYKSFLRR